MGSVELHRRVKKALYEIEKNSKWACYNVEVIAERAKTDTRTTKKHLAILEENGFGNFCDPKGKTFTSNEKFKELFKEVSK